MPSKIPERKPRDDEVRALKSSDGKMCVAIVKRTDGLFWCFEDVLSYDEDDDVLYWSRISNPSSGLYRTVEEAELDMRLRFAQYSSG
jgi:hypothetical protein